MIKRAAPVALAALVILIAPVASAQDRFPRFSAPVVDAADVVPDDEEEQINAQLLSYQRRSTNQIAVAVVSTLGRASIEDYSEDLFDAWGVGEEGKDNGALLVVAMRERDLRIEVGYGLEGDLTDLESGDIVDKMTPLMREGDVGGAISLATGEIRRALGDTEAPVPEEPQSEEDEDGGGGLFSLLYVLFPLLFIFGGLGGRRRGRRRRDFSMWPILLGGGWGGSGRSGGFGGGGFGGGGFGGGGGGGSGGGGASGGW